MDFLSSQASSVTLVNDEEESDTTVKDALDEQDTFDSQQESLGRFHQVCGPVRVFNLTCLFSLSQSITARIAAASPISTFFQSECYHWFWYDSYVFSWSKYQIDYSLIDCSRRLSLAQCYWTYNWISCGHHSRPWCWLFWNMVRDFWTCAECLLISLHRALASQYVCVDSAVYSFHSTLRDARICYLRALVGGIVCFIQHDGLTECIVLPCIPIEDGFQHWWEQCWRSWDADQGLDLPVPIMKP